MANTFQFGGSPYISERRRHWRQKVFLSSVELGENNHGDVLNISPSGLALQAVEELTDDVLPNMRFQLSQASAWIEAKGRIAWRDDSKKVAGVEFVDISPQTRKQILLLILLASDESEFPKTDAPLEKTEQVSGSMANSEAISAFPFLESTMVELVPEDQSHPSTPLLVQSPAELQDTATVSDRDMAANVISGSRKAVHLVGWSLAAVLLLLVFLPLLHYLQKAGTSQKGRETTAEPNLPGPSSKILAAPNPGATPDHPAPASNLGSSLGHPAFVLQVGAMASEENAIALADSLGQTKLPAFVFKGPTDRFHHVFVGPFTSVDATLTAKKDLEKRGFKPFRTEWKAASQ